MYTSSQHLTLLFIFGSILLVLLICIPFIFVIVYQHRMINRLAGQQRKRTEQQREVLHAIFESQENEHKRVASCLHHEVGKVISTIHANLVRLEKKHTLAMGEPHQLSDLLVQTRQLSEEATVEVQNLIRSMQPPLLADFGLVVAVTDLCTTINQRTYWQVSFQYNDGYFRLKSEAELSVYRIIQELFNNAMLHSGGTNISVSLQINPEEIQLVFTDNGIGFDSDEVYQKEPIKRPGLLKLESRVELLGGSFQLDTYIRGGTRVEVKLNSRLLII